MLSDDLESWTYLKVILSSEAGLVGFLKCKTNQELTEKME